MRDYERKEPTMNKERDIPVFPCVIKDRQFPNNTELERLPGMTLRDYFANSAMQGLVNEFEKSNEDRSVCSYYLAKRAYEIADAMLQERERKSL